MRRARSTSSRLRRWRRAPTASPKARHVSRIEGAGFTQVTGLHKDDMGIWRGKAMRNGKASMSASTTRATSGRSEAAASHTFYHIQLRRPTWPHVPLPRCSTPMPQPPPPSRVWSGGHSAWRHQHRVQRSGSSHRYLEANGDNTGTATGASLGTVLGGGAGLLAGLGMLAIPGLGPVVAAGWLASTLVGAGVGAAAGGVVGALTDAGVSHEDAHAYAEGINRGGTLVTFGRTRPRRRGGQHPRFGRQRST